MIGFPLDSHVTFDDDGNPSFDRGLTSAPLRSLIRGLVTDGVLADASRIFDDVTSDSMLVSPGGGMDININKGFGICHSCLKLNERVITLTATRADSSYDRIDTVVLRLNNNEEVRECEFYIVAGTPSSTPQAPALTRNASIWEIGIANILIPSNSTEITTARITDTRLDSTRCGLITSIADFDTSDLYDQIQADLHDFQVNQEAQWDTWQQEEEAYIQSWIDSIRNILDEETAVHLLNMIYDDRDEMGPITQRRTTTYPDDGSIVETLQDGRRRVTTFPNDGSIVETAYSSTNEVLWIKTTTFLDDGSMREDIANG